MTTTTPNMGMVLPEVSDTLGPAWAALLLAALEVVDLHDHTDGNGVVLPNGTWTVSAPASYPYTILTTDTQKVLAVSATAAARTLTLPAATNVMHVIVKDADNIAATHNITVVADGSDTIDGAASFVLDSGKQAAGFISDGFSKWLVI